MEIDRLINEAYYQNSKKELQQIRDVVAESKLPNKSDELLLIDAYIAVIDQFAPSFIISGYTKHFTDTNREIYISNVGGKQYRHFPIRFLVSRTIKQEKRNIILETERRGEFNE